MIHKTKALDQPAPEKTGTASQENARAAHFLPQWSSVLQNQFQVLLGKRVRWAHQSSKGEMIIFNLNTSQGHAAPSRSEAKRTGIRMNTQRSRHGFTTFSTALCRLPRVLPVFVCLAMCPSAARSRDGNRPALVASI